MYNPYFDRRPKQEEPDEPIVWETDANGRQFRKVGNCIEYRPTIQTSGGTFYQDEVADAMKRFKKQDEERYKAEAKRMQEMQTNRNCPFKVGRNQVKTDCEKTCPFYDNGCVLAGAPTNPTTNTDGKYCPIAGRCNTRCAMYANGCKLIEMLKCMKHGKE